MSLLASVCSEVVDSWNDLAVHFGTHRPGVTSELRPIPSLEGQVFDDPLIRPRFAVLRLVLDLREYEFVIRLTFSLFLSLSLFGGGRFGKI